MTIDDRITEALRDVPTAPQRPLGDIAARGRAFKRRRRAAVGVAVLGCSLLALPWANSLGGRETDGAVIAPAPEPPPCPTAAWEVTHEELSDWDFLLGPSELPDELRLLWPESVPVAPTAAESSVATAITPYDEYFASCSITQQEATLIYLDGDEVGASIWIQYTSIPYEHPPGRGGEPSPIERVIAAGDSEIGLWHGEPGKDILHASWGDDNEWWDIVTKRPLTDDELIELATAARFADGAIDLSEWSLADEASHVEQTSISAREPEIYNLHVKLNGGGSLMTRTSSEDLLSNARPGHRLIDLDGQPALLEQQPAEDSNPGSVAVMWKPSPDVLASVSADAGNDEFVLDIARGLEPVPPDDARLTEVWDDSMAESWNE